MGVERKKPVMMGSGEVMSIMKHITETGQELDRFSHGDLSDECKSAVTFMANRYADPIGLDDLAREASTSKFKFIKLFRRETGVNPGAFLQHYRISKAMHLLVETDRSIKAISQDVGYCDQAAFSRIFLRLTGTQPHMYRRIKKQRSAEVAIA